MHSDPPEFLHPRPGKFSRRDALKSGALVGGITAGLASIHASAQNATPTAAKKPDDRADFAKNLPEAEEIHQPLGLSLPRCMSLRECLQLAKDAGFDGIELNYDLDNDLSPKSGPADCRDSQKMADEVGIAISGLLQFPLLYPAAHEQRPCETGAGPRTGWFDREGRTRSRCRKHSHCPGSGHDSLA